MLPFSPRLRIALATAEELAKAQGRRSVTCCDIVQGLVSLSGGVADNLLKNRGFNASLAPVSTTAINHEVVTYTADSLRALAAAMVDSARRSHTLVGVEDMLIGLLSPPSPEIATLFAEKNVNREELLFEVRKEIEGT